MKEGKLKKRVQGSQGKPLLFTELKAEQGSTEPEVPTEQTVLICESGALFPEEALGTLFCIDRCALLDTMPFVWKHCCLISHYLKLTCVPQTAKSHPAAQ